MKSLTLVSSVLAITLGVGCSGGEDEWTRNLPETVNASGFLLMDGKPLEGATLVLIPSDGGKHAANAVSDSSGAFEFKAFPSKEGAVPGKYKVTVSKTIEVQGGTSPRAELPESVAEEGAAHAAEETAGVDWVNALPKQYANPNTSGLTAEIPPDGTDDLKFELKK